MSEMNPILPEAMPAGNRAQAPASEPAPNSNADRRQRRRAVISAPVRVRAGQPNGRNHDEVCLTIDVSRCGVLFETPSAFYQRGMDVTVTFPFTTAPNAIHVEQHGRVVRIAEAEDGRWRVAIALDQAVETADSRGRKPGKAAEPAKHTKFPADSSQPPSGLPLVVVVEAEESVRRTLKNYLKGEGYEVFAALSGADAREVMELFTPALLIAEIEGQDLPGLDLCAHVKTNERLRHVPVVLTTRSGYPTDYSNAHALGAVVCMAKPYNQDRLGHIVRLLAPLPAHAEMPANSRHGSHSRRSNGSTKPQPVADPEPARRPYVGGAFR